MTRSEHDTNRKIAETELFEPVKKLLEAGGYLVHSEVKDCDIVAQKDEILLVVELKSSFNATLLIQAAKRQRTAELVYIAIPMIKEGTFSKHWKDICHLVRRLELGMIAVTFLKSGTRADVIFDPAPFDRKQSRALCRKKRTAILEEIDGRHGNYNVGGSTRQKIMTAYRENAIHILCCLQKFGQLTIKQLKEFDTGSKTGTILRMNYYGWFERVNKGVYKATPVGIDSLKDYPDLAAYYMEKLD